MLYIAILTQKSEPLEVHFEVRELTPCGGVHTHNVWSERASVHLTPPTTEKSLGTASQGIDHLVTRGVSSLVVIRFRFTIR